MFAQQEELVMKVGEIKKYDAKTRQLSFSGKLVSSSPFLFFFFHASADAADAKGKPKQAIFIERLAPEAAASGKDAKRGKATVTLGLGSAAEEKALLTKGTGLFAFKPALTIHTELTQ
jgi:hypothetical protein